MKCPVCEHTALMMTERSGIEIDYCPQCRGVWLDRGELDKIIERSSQDQRPTEVRRTENYNAHGFGHHGGHHKDYDREHHGRKKSFWNELFD